MLQYLSEMRRRINNQVEALKISPSQAHQFPFLSETSVEELFELPSIPLPSLTPEQLTRFAQIVDTALFKAYLVIRPGLLGPLCSLPNWCEVQEVEETLMEKEVSTNFMSLPFSFLFTLVRNTPNSSLSIEAGRCIPRL